MAPAQISFKEMESVPIKRPPGADKVSVSQPITTDGIEGSSADRGEVQIGDDVDGIWIASASSPLSSSALSASSASSASSSSSSSVSSSKDYSGTVDGLGLFRNWRHSFGNAKNALLDIIDNCFDACLHKSFPGRIQVKAPEGGELVFTNTVIPKNAAPDLGRVLRLFDSEKIYGGSVGQMGVGLKQGCVFLS